MKHGKRMLTCKYIKSKQYNSRTKAYKICHKEILESVDLFEAENWVNSYD